MPLLSGDDVAEQIRRALRREIPVRLAELQRTWDAVFAGDVEFIFGDWRVTFFNDCDDLDYCDHAIAPDGRRGNFDDWHSVFDADGNVLREVAEPCMYLLSRIERDDLVRLLKAAT